MAVSTKVEFFAPVSPFGDFDGWEIQTGGNPSKAKARASDLGKTGDEIAHETYDDKTSVSAVYTLTSRTGNITLPSVGQILSGYHIDSVSVAFSQTAWPKLTVAGHKHDLGNADTACRTYKPSLIFAAQTIGVPESVSDSANPAVVVFKLNDGTPIGMRSMSYAIAVNHVDEMNGKGGHLAGDNYDGNETLTCELTGDAVVTETGAADAGDVTVDSTKWTMTTNAKTQGNTAATTHSLTLVHHLAHEAA